jgi:uncharacterized protein (TIGR02444 family)
MLHLKTPATIKLLVHHPFWQFSCEIYKETKDVLLAMQSHHDLNVNVILFCYWFSANHQKSLSKNDIKRLLSAIHKWHQHTVHPLRALRNSLQKHDYLDWVNIIRKEVLASELMAEKIEQSLIVNLFTQEACCAKNTNTRQSILYAFRSIKFYCEVLYITPNEQDYADFIQIAHKIFPDIKKESVTALGYSMLKQTNHKHCN